MNNNSSSGFISLKTFLIIIIIGGVSIFIFKLINGKKEIDKAMDMTYKNSVYSYIESISYYIDFNEASTSFEEDYYNAKIPYNETCDLENLTLTCKQFYLGDTTTNPIIYGVNNNHKRAVPVKGKITISKDKTIKASGLMFKNSKYKWSYDGEKAKIE